MAQLKHARGSKAVRIFTHGTQSRAAVGGWRFPSWMAVALSMAVIDLAAAAGVPLYYIRSDYAPGEITKLCKSAIEKNEKIIKAVESIEASARTAANTLLAYEGSIADLSDETAPLIFMASVSRDLEPRADGKSVHDEGSVCEELVGQHLVSVATRRPLYEALSNWPKAQTGEAAGALTVSAKKGAGAAQPAASTLLQRLRSETLKDFELNGLKLPEDKLALMRKYKQELTSLESQYSNNLNNDKSTVAFTAQELEGVSAAFLERLKKSADGTHYEVTTKSTDYRQVMENAVDSATRKRMMLAYYNRAAGTNVKLLEEAIQLRQKIAAVMGFSTWADYRIQKRMAANGKEVLEFLNGLRGKLAKRNQQDLAAMRAFYKEDCIRRKVKDSEFRVWDLPYADFQLKKKKFDLDDEKVREYFPASRVISGMFDVYSKLFGVKFVQVVDFGELASKALWSPDVQLYEVRDSKSEALLAYFYTDFVPRPGKYGHAAAFSLVGGRLLADGKYSVPVSAIVANLAPPSGDRPSLLNHQEVETVFHEFGHIMHQVLTRVDYASLSGSSVSRDYVEAPSQMLENWVWSETVLPLLSGHYKDQSQKLPADMIKKMLAARDFNRGYFYTRQLLLGLLDMTYHTTKGAVDTTAVYERLAREIVGLKPIEGGHFQASFGHLMGGYDAGYYGYLWSEVYAQDLFSVFEKKGILNAAVGTQYRQWILEQGNAQEASDLLRGFLGRKPNATAFFKRLGVK